MERRFFLYLFATILAILLLFLPTYGQDSEEIEELKLQGREYYRDGNFDAAELTFTSIFSLDSNSISARNNLGVLYKTLGRYNDALRVYFEAESIVRRDFDLTGDTIARYLSGQKLFLR